MNDDNDEGKSYMIYYHIFFALLYSVIGFIAGAIIY